MAKYDVFISYSRKDSEFAEKVCAVFDAYKKFYKFEYFFDREEIKSANEYLERISEAISECNTMFFLASKNSYSSRFCSKELLFANEYNVTIHRYCIDNSKPPKKINLLLIDQHFQEASTCPIEKMVCQVLSDALKKDILPLSDLNNASKDILQHQYKEDDGIELVKGETNCALVNIETDIDCRILRFGKEIAVARTAEFSSIRLPKGKHKLAFIELTEGLERHECLLDIKDIEYEDFIEVKLLDKYNTRKTAELAEQRAKEEAARKTYQVGDYYNENGKEGVVFEVSADGKYGKIVSMTQSRERLLWSSYEAELKRLIGADSKIAGAYNMTKVKAVANWQEKYPAFKWCADLGEGWYLPSIEELKKFTSDDAVLDAVNRTLISKGGEKLFNRGDRNKCYWSSTESNEQYDGVFYAWFVYIYDGYRFGDFRKYGACYVRAVSAF
ncbi:MAG: TIR domain-containing protein [Alistipes sp.]|nr:TIR domain-containing protein [Alistipes sp.]